MRTAPVMALIALALASAAAQGAPPTPDDVAEKVQTRYDATSDFTAAVRQELSLASGGKTSTATGIVAFKKPGKMRWELREGASQLIVADGHTLWFYEPDEKQVLKAPFQSAFRSTTPISFLTGVGRLRDDFTVATVARGDGVLHLELVPRKPDADLGKLRLDVDPNTYDIVGAEITDPVGNRTRVFFTDLKRNVGLAESVFQFEIPPGVDVVEAPIGS